MADEKADMAEKVVEWYGRLLGYYQALREAAQEVVDNDDRLDMQVAIHSSNQHREKAIDNLREVLKTCPRSQTDKAGAGEVSIPGSTPGEGSELRGSQVVKAGGRKPSIAGSNPAHATKPTKRRQGT